MGGREQITEWMSNKSVESSKTGNTTVDTFLQNTPTEYQEIFKKILWTDSKRWEQIIHELNWWADMMSNSMTLSSAIENESDYTHWILTENGQFSWFTTEKWLYSIGNLTVIYGDPLTLKLNGEEYQKVNKQDFLKFLDEYDKINKIQP